MGLGASVGACKVGRGAEQRVNGRRRVEFEREHSEAGKWKQSVEVEEECTVCESLETMCDACA